MKKITTKIVAVKGKSLAALGIMELAVALFFVAAAYLYAVYFGFQGANALVFGLVVALAAVLGGFAMYLLLTFALTPKIIIIKQDDRLIMNGRCVECADIASVTYGSMGARGVVFKTGILKIKLKSGKKIVCRHVAEAEEVCAEISSLIVKKRF